jgi:hypothetical protein
MPLYYYSAMIFRSQNVDSVVVPAQAGHFIRGVGLMQWRIPVDVTPLSTEDYLFDRQNDPAQAHNHWQEKPAVRRRMLETLRGLLAQEGAPAEQYARLGLN